MNNEHEQALRAIAHLAEKIRRDTGATPWNYHAILKALRRGVPATKTIPEIARATLWFAQHRTTQDTPLMLSEEGTHWHLDAAKHDPTATPQVPSFRDRWKHEPKTTPATPDTIKAMRQRLREGTT